MIIVYTVLSMNKILRSSSIEMASGLVGKVRSKGTSEFQLFGRTGLVMLDQVLHVPKTFHNLVLVAVLYEDRHTVQVTKSSCVIKMRKKVVGVGRSTDEMYLSTLRRW